MLGPSCGPYHPTGLDLARWRIVGRTKDRHQARHRAVLAFAIAAPGGLRDLVETRLGAPDSRKIDIDAGLDQRGGDQATRASASRAFRTLSRILPAMRRILPRCQVNEAVEPGCIRITIEGERMLAAVDDDEASAPSPERVHKRSSLFMAPPNSPDGPA